MVLAYEGFFDIVIKRSSLEKIREGLSYEFISDYQVGDAHFDENLIIIRGGMSEDVADYVIDNLETKYNLVHLQNGVAQDMVRTIRGNICSECFWLKSGTLKDEMMIGDEAFPKYFPFYEIV